MSPAEQSDRRYEQWMYEMEWYVLATSGDGANSFLVPGSQLHDALHQEMCDCDKPWAECGSEGVKQEVSRLDNPNEWSCDYPGFEKYMFQIDGEDCKIDIIRLTEHPYAQVLDIVPAVKGPTFLQNLSEVLGADSRKRLDRSLEAIQSELHRIHERQQINQESLMSNVKDLQAATAAIQAAVQDSTISLTQLVSDTNTALAALKAQEGPVTQEQLDAIVAQNNTVLMNLQTLNAAIKTEDTALTPAPPAAAPPAPTPAATAPAPIDQAPASAATDPATTATAEAPAEPATPAESGVAAGAVDLGGKPLVHTAP